MSLLTRIGRLALLAAGTLSSALATRALDPSRALTQYTLQTWDSGTGLPQGSVQALLQTRDGYIWLGTQEGLVRFNGERFSVVRTAAERLGEPADVRCIVEDKDGSLWVGTYGGGLFHRGTQRVRFFTTDDRLAGDTVLCMAVDESGALWAGTETGLSRIVGEAGVTSYRTGDGLPGDDVEALLSEPGGRVWIGTNRGLCRYEAGRMVPVPLGAFGAAGILGLYRDHEGRLWVGGRAGAVVLEDPRTSTPTPVEGLPPGEAWCFLEDRDGSLWVGTSSGLCRIRDGKVETLGTAQGLSYPAVRNLLEDAEGSLWVGTTSGGLNQLRDGSFTTFTSREGLPADFVWCAADDPQGGVWVGTDLGGLCHLKESRVRVYGEADGIPIREITALCVGADGRVWAGGRDALYVGREGGPFRRYGTQDGLPGGRVRAILAPRAGGGVWVASHGGGLSFFNGKSFKTYTRAEGLPGDFVRCLAETKDGSLWLGTHSAGLCRFKDGRFEVPAGSEAFRGAQMMGFLEDSEGNLWIAANGEGLLLYRAGRWSRFDSADGLLDEKPFLIAQDRLGALWVTGNRGIVRLSRAALLARADGRPADIKPDVFGTPDGLRTAECNGGAQPSGCRTPDGRLWFATAKGLAVVDPARLKHNPHPPPVLLEEFLAAGKGIPWTGEAVLPPGTRNLEFHYTALSFLAPQRVRFQYRLEGYDEDWVDAGTRRVAYYTVLPPGRYTFRVRACNNDGVWNDSGASATFRVKPRLDQRWPFRAALAVVGAALLYGLFRGRMHQLRVRGAELERAVAQRTAELQEANAELGRLASTDGLTGLPNHRAFHERLAHECRRAVRTGAPLSVVVADIDHFKRYNDGLGHLEGDRALKRVADALAGALHRPGDFAARYGGEEFAFVLPETSKEGAGHVAETLRVAVVDLREAHPDSEVAPVITISLGAASGIVSAGAQTDELLGKADAALYRAKAAGRNRAVID